MVDTVQTAIYKLGLDTAQYTQAAAGVEQANQKIVSSTTGVEVATEKVSVATRTTADSFAKLEARYDPLIRLEQQRQAALAAANRHLEEGIIDQARYAAQVDRVNTAIRNQVQSQLGQVVQLGRATTAGGRFGGAMQQAGFQVADFAVQVASGQGALRAFVQQGSQLLGFFGPFGALAGAAIAVGGALAMTFLDLGNSAEKAAEQQEKFNATYDRLSKLMDEINGKAQRTRESMTAEVGNTVGQAELALRQAEADLARTPRLTGGKGGTVVRDDYLEKEAEVDRLRQELTLLRAQAGEFGDRFSGPSGGNIFSPPKATATNSGRVTIPGPEIGPIKTDAFDRSVQALMDRLNPVEAKVFDVTAQQGLLSVAFQKGAITAEQYADGMAKLSAQLNDNTAPAVDAATASVERFNEETAKIDLQLMESKRAGEDVITTFTNGFGEVAASIGQSGFNLREMGRIGEGVLNRLIDLMAQLLFVNPLNNALGVGGGTAPTLASVGTSLFGAFLGGAGGGGAGYTAGTVGASGMFGHLAEGGPALKDRPYIVGEEGPELFVPPVSGTVIPNDKLRAMTSNDNRRTVNLKQTFILPPNPNGFGRSPYQLAQRAAEQATRALR
jgi:hypothetical protein